MAEATRERRDRRNSAPTPLAPTQLVNQRQNHAWTPTAYSLGEDRQPTLRRPICDLSDARNYIEACAAPVENEESQGLSVDSDSRKYDNHSEHSDLFVCRAGACFSQSPPNNPAVLDRSERELNYSFSKMNDSNNSYLSSTGKCKTV